MVVVAADVVVAVVVVVATDVVDAIVVVGAIDVVETGASGMTSTAPVVAHAPAATTTTAATSAGRWERCRRGGRAIPGGYRPAKGVARPVDSVVG